MSLNYTQNDIYKKFESGAVRRGNDCYLNGKVLTMTYVANSNVVYGVVRGSANQQYDVRVNINAQQGHVNFQAVCTCPVRHDCKHAVALLLASWYRETELAVQQNKVQTSNDDEVESWLGKLEKELSAKPNDKQNGFFSNETNRLLYILKVQSYANGNQLFVQYVSARLLKAGGYGKESRFDPYRIVNQAPAAFLTPDDQTILREICIRKMMDFIDVHTLSTAGGGELLLKMLATGRCYWMDKNGQALSLGEAKKSKLVWQTFDDGLQQLRLKAEENAVTVLPTVPPYYLDELNQQCGPLETNIPDTALHLLKKAPKVALEDISLVVERLDKIVQGIPVPVTLDLKNKSGIKPIPCMRFCLVDDKMNESYDAYDYYDPLPAMEIQLDYDGHKISLFSENQEISYRQGSLLIKLTRDSKAEAIIDKQLNSRYVEQLRDIELDMSYPPDLFSIDYPDFDSEADGWITFILNDVPKLRELGWQISFDDDFPYNISQIDEWQMDIEDRADNQWFDLSLDIVVNEQKYNLIDIISTLIQQNPRFFKDIQSENYDMPENILIRLSDGVLLAIPTDRIARIVNILLELFDKKADLNSKISLPRWRAAELNELQSQGLQWQGSETLKASAERLSKFKGIKSKTAPKKFKANLRDYQKEGLGWLQFLREYEFHGILADDMGLGKTVQALAHISTEKAAKRLANPVLVIAPTSLMYNWRVEAEQFAPHLKLLTLHGPDRKKDFEHIAEYDIVLSTYPLLMRDGEVLLAQDWHMLILDEAQNIKNPKAKATKVACQLKAKHRLCLTGTPMENHLGELWSIFNFLMPGLLGNERQFRQLFRTPIEKQANAERAQQLAKRLAPFMLRRTKDEVVKELPSKTEIIRSVALEGVQRDLYETVRISMQKKVRDSIDKLGLNKSHIIVLDALLKLRQICCDPRLLKTEAKAGSANAANSAKFELLMSLLPELLEEGRKILLFSQFTSMLSLIEPELKARNIKYVKLTGNTRNREKVIAEFQNDEVPLFLISLKAGGTGLNLTAADTVIHYDPWWNPAVEAQATDRAHRIGQQKPVFVYKLLTEGTVEEKIQTMQANKRKLAEGLFDNAGKGKLPSANDLQALFEPLEG